jgi:hypothetical protein
MACASMFFLLLHEVIHKLPKFYGKIYEHDRNISSPNLLIVLLGILVFKFQFVDLAHVSKSGRKAFLGSAEALKQVWLKEKIA